tara:strand:+ start:582 stop:827 length:246 start_codon:yes stop_codon:yes gene_type:complete
MKNTIANSVMLTIITTVVLRLLQNKSQIAHQYAIPLVVSAVLWYIIGNWDTKNMYSLTNLLYWIIIMVFSWTIVLFVDYFR